MSDYDTDTIGIVEHLEDATAEHELDQGCMIRFSPEGYAELNRVLAPHDQNLEGVMALTLTTGTFTIMTDPEQTERFTIIPEGAHE